MFVTLRERDGYGWSRDGHGNHSKMDRVLYNSIILKIKIIFSNDTSFKKFKINLQYTYVIFYLFEHLE
jgi:hypothetical protein